MLLLERPLIHLDECYYGNTHTSNIHTHSLQLDKKITRDFHIWSYLTTLGGSACVHYPPHHLNTYTHTHTHTHKTTTTKSNDVSQTQFSETWSCYKNTSERGSFQSVKKIHSTYSTCITRANYVCIDLNMYRSL